jgi:hypothetical protein
VGERGADFGPAFTGFTVALVFLDGEDVQVRERRIANGNGSGRIRAREASQSRVSDSPYRAMASGCGFG